MQQNRKLARKILAEQIDEAMNKSSSLQSLRKAKVSKQKDRRRRRRMKKDGNLYDADASEKEIMEESEQMFEFVSNEKETNETVPKVATQVAAQDCSPNLISSPPSVELTQANLILQQLLGSIK